MDEDDDRERIRDSRDKFKREREDYPTHCKYSTLIVFTFTSCIRKNSKYQNLFFDAQTMQL